MLRSLRHRNIMEVFKGAKDNFGGGWLVMELIEGSTLEARIYAHEDGQLGQIEALSFLRQILSGK